MEWNKELKECRLCPHQCKVNRLTGQLGRCHCSDKIEIAFVSLHKYEEPCISGKNGSGTIFFSHCNLKCCYCQNYKISQMGKGKEITITELAQIMMRQQENKAHNINLVTGTMYVPQIREAIKIAKKQGLSIPIIYNTNAYERKETIQMLEGYIDVYLPDMKYYSEKMAVEYSKAPQYFKYASIAIKEMEKQVGEPKFDQHGMIQKGVMVRHLVLPNHILNTKHILKWLKKNLKPETYINIMAQYFPTYQAFQYPKLNRKLTKKEYQQIENDISILQLENGYMQELGEHEEEYVPNF